MESKNALEKQFYFCLHRKQEAVDSFQVDLDLVDQGETSWKAISISKGHNWSSQDVVIISKFSPWKPKNAFAHSQQEAV